MAIAQNGETSYYAVLGVEQNSSAAEIRAAYRKLAMLWHPDRCRGLDKPQVELAKRKFQQIQEAYNVLSDDAKRVLYDLSLFDAADSDKDIRGLRDFVDELCSMMVDVRAQTQHQSQNETFQDLQRTFIDMFRADLDMWGLNLFPHRDKKRTWENLPQYQQFPVKSQRVASVEFSTMPRNRLPVQTVLTEYRPRDSAAKKATDVSPQRENMCCYARCYVGSSFNNGIGLL